MAEHPHNDDAPFDPRLANAADRDPSSPSPHNARGSDRLAQSSVTSKSWSSSQSLQRIEIAGDPNDLGSPRVMEVESRSVNGHDTTIFRVTDGRGTVREYDSPEKLPQSVLESMHKFQLPAGTELPDDVKSEMRVILKDVVREFEKGPFAAKLDVRDIEADLERAMRGETTQIIGKVGLPQRGPVAWLLKRGLHADAAHRTAERGGTRITEADPRRESDFIGAGPRDPFADHGSSRNRMLYAACAVVAIALILIFVLLTLR